MASAQPYVTTIYSAPYWQPLISVVFLVALCVISMMVSKRFPGFRYSDWKGQKMMRLAFVFILLDSLLFVFIAALMVLGVGTSRSLAACNGALFLCITLYAFTKLLITFFFVERAHIVHGNLEMRRKSKLYMANCIWLLGWVAPFLAFVITSKGTLRPSDDYCVYILGGNIAYPIWVGCFDIISDAYFSLLFAVPLYRNKFLGASTRRIAFKSLLAAVVAMLSSASNLIVMAALKHKELSWLCMTACTLDTLMNCSVLYVVTSKERTPEPARTSRVSPSTYDSEGEMSHPHIRSPTMAHSRIQHIVPFSGPVEEEYDETDPEAAHRARIREEHRQSLSRIGWRWSMQNQASHETSQHSSQSGTPKSPAPSSVKVHLDSEIKEKEEGSSSSSSTEV